MNVGFKAFLVFFLILISFSTSNCFSQFSSSAEANLQGMIGSKQELPFWMYSNQRGRVSDQTKLVSRITGETNYSMSTKSLLTLGAGIFYQDQREDVQVDELFIQYSNSLFTAILGRKQTIELYNGLSSSNESILWSLNARPLPGIKLGTARPVFLVPVLGLGFEGSLEEYFMDDSRYVRNTRLHHKKLHLVFQPGNSVQLKVGLQHFVQWGGTSPSMGKQPGGFDDYLRIFTGQSGGEDAWEGDQLNALGNNLGSYEAYLNFTLKEYYISLFWNHLFEDGSGRRLGNTPDGRYGLYVQQLNPDQWIHSYIYEFYYTKHQSHTTSGIHKYDNYLNNGIYRSGWTYENKTIGSPFFSADENGKGIINNTMIVHHIGFGGNAFHKFPYRFISSYRKNSGVNRLGLYSETQNILSTFLDLRIVSSFCDLSLQVGSDVSDSRPKYGFGFNLYKKF